MSLSYIVILQRYIDLIVESGAELPEFLASIGPEYWYQDAVKVDQYVYEKLKEIEYDLCVERPELPIAQGLACAETYGAKLVNWLLTSENVSQLLQRLNQLDRSQAVHCQILNTDTLTCQLMPEGYDIFPGRLFTLAAFVTLYRHALGPVEVRIHINEVREDRRRLLGERLDCAVHYDADNSFILIQGAQISVKSLLTRQDHLSRLLAPQGQIPSLHIDTRDLSFLVEREIKRHLDGGGASLQHICECLSVNPRTLQRRLKEQGTTFQELLHQVRKRKAAGLLRQRQMTHSKVLDQVGYKDLSSLYRLLRQRSQVGD